MPFLNSLNNLGKVCTHAPEACWVLTAAHLLLFIVRSHAALFGNCCQNFSLKLIFNKGSPTKVFCKCSWQFHPVIGKRLWCLRFYNLNWLPDHFSRRVWMQAGGLMSVSMNRFKCLLLPCTSKKNVRIGKILSSHLFGKIWALQSGHSSKCFFHITEQWSAKEMARNSSHWTTWTYCRGFPYVPETALYGCISGPIRYSPL